MSRQDDEEGEDTLEASIRSSKGISKLVGDSLPAF